MKRKRDKTRQAPSQDPASRWFRALIAFDREALEALLAEGVDVNLRDRDGWNALFYAAGPWGGDPGLTAWLLERGADPNVLDHEGKDPVERGSECVASALEANMLAEHRRLLEEARARTSKTRRDKRRGRKRSRGKQPPARPDPIGPQGDRDADTPADESAFFGRFRVIGGGVPEVLGTPVRIRRGAVDGAPAWLHLRGAAVQRTGPGELVMEGEDVRVSLTVEADGRLQLRWCDDRAVAVTLVLARREALRS